MEEVEIYEGVEFNKEWKLWCRLCAKSNTEKVNIFTEWTQPYNNYKIEIIAAIKKFFHIKFTLKEKLPQVVCIDCLKVITTFIKLAARVCDIQEMFNKLEESSSSTQDLKKLFEKYGIDYQGLFIKNTVKLTEVQSISTYIRDNTWDSKITSTQTIIPNGIIHEKENDLIETIFFENNDPTDPLNGQNSSTGSSCDDALSCESDRRFKEIEAVELSKINTIHMKRKHNVFGESLNSKTSKDDPKDEVEKDSEPKEDAIDKPKRKRSKSSEELVLEPKVSCKICSMGFQRHSNYVTHMKKKHKEELRKNPEYGIDPDEIPKKKRLKASEKRALIPKIACKICLMGFQRHSNYTSHMKKIHKIVGESLPYTCKICNQAFQNKSLMTQHFKSTHGNKETFVCEECGAIIIGSIRTLRDHMLTHTNYAPFECKVCGKCFKRDISLKRHMDIHGEKHICNDCGLQLSSRATLYHHSFVHSDAMPHKCDYCGRAFKRAKTLKNHLILHTGLKPYACDFCEMTFSNGTSCRTHKKNMHPVEFANQEASGEKPNKAKCIPKLSVLKSVTRTAQNLKPVAPKRSGNFSLGKKPKLGRTLSKQHQAAVIDTKCADFVVNKNKTNLI